jgi:hypothetical protein
MWQILIFLKVISVTQNSNKNFKTPGSSGRRISWGCGGNNTWANSTGHTSNNNNNNNITSTQSQVLYDFFVRSQHNNFSCISMNGVEAII